jgi:hypothetical protein
MNTEENNGNFNTPKSQKRRITVTLTRPNLKKTLKRIDMRGHIGQERGRDGGKGAARRWRGSGVGEGLVDPDNVWTTRHTGIDFSREFRRIKAKN